MPTIIYIYGWRLFFYSNEGNEPIHIHAEKADIECKFWILEEEIEIKEAYAYNLNQKDRKEIKKIIYQHFDLIVDSWYKYFEKKNAINLGFGWDRIENVLWRVYNGELDNIAPSQIVIMIGISGAGNGIRTRDLCLGKATLYQLSYSRNIHYNIK